VVAWPDCTTSLMYPYITNLTGGLGLLGNWDTAIEVANGTSVPSTFHLASTYIPQNGACTFSFYSAGTSSTVGTATAATPITYTTPVILSGGDFAFTLSMTPGKGIAGGYATAVCNFQHGAGYAAIANPVTSPAGPTWALYANYLALVE